MVEGRWFQAWKCAETLDVIQNSRLSGASHRFPSRRSTGHLQGRQKGTRYDPSFFFQAEDGIRDTIPSRRQQILKQTKSPSQDGKRLLGQDKQDRERKILRQGLQHGDTIKSAQLCTMKDRR